MTKEEALQLQESILLLKREKSNKPKISRHLKRMTYYRERFALQMKAIIDEMILESGKGEFKERFFKYESYQDVLTKNSLYLKISQSWLYLRNELDPEGIYKRFAEQICIVRRKDGIRIQYQKDDTSELIADIVVPEKEQRKEYMSKIEEFLDTAKEGDEITIPQLRLTDEEISNVEASVCQLENFIYKILPNKIWMVKIGD